MEKIFESNCRLMETSKPHSTLGKNYATNTFANWIKKTSPGRRLTFHNLYSPTQFDDELKPLFTRF